MNTKYIPKSNTQVTLNLMHGGFIKHDWNVQSFLTKSHEVTLNLFRGLQKSTPARKILKQVQNDSSVVRSNNIKIEYSSNHLDSRNYGG